MKKKICAFAITVFLSLPIFADSKNIVYNESFDFKNVDSLQINLTCENLNISRIYGDEIVVEIGTNNIKKLPVVTLEQNDDYGTGTLTITSTIKKVSLGFNSTVYLYLPQDFLPGELYISNVSGNIQSDVLVSVNNIIIKNVSGRTDIAGINTDYFSAAAASGNIKIQKLSAGYFDINNVSGNIFAELEKSFEAKSKITTISGKIQVYYKKNESPFTDDSPDFIISSVSGKIETVPFD
jgi:DUF4097 and DUF4098 domain-containing protein YvlB